MSSLRQLLGNAFIYTLSSALSAAVPFFLLPIFTRYLTREDYGILTMFGVLASILSLLSGLSTVGSVLRRFVDQAELHFPSYVVSCIWIWATSSSFVTIGMILLGPIVSTLVQIPYPTILWVLPIVFMNYPLRLALNVWRSQGKAIQFGATEVGLSIIQFTGAITLVVYYGLGWEGRYIAQGLAGFTGLILAFRVLGRNGFLSGYWSKEYASDALSYGLPFIPHTLSYLAMLYIGQFSVLHLHGLEAVGLYAVGIQIGLAVTLIADSVNVAYVPFAFNQLKTNTASSKRRLVYAQYGLLSLSLIIGLVMWFVGPFIGRVMLGENFVEASVFIGWAGLLGSLQLAYYVFVTLMLYQGRTKTLAKLSMSSAILSVPASFLMVAFFGPLGAVMAQVCIRALLVCAVFASAKDIGKLPWNILRA